MTDKRVKAATARALKAMREQSGLSQAAVAEHLGTTQATVSRWENGSTTPDAGDVVMLAAVYGMGEQMPGLSAAINEAQRVLGRKKR